MDTPKPTITLATKATVILGAKPKRILPMQANKRETVTVDQRQLLLPSATIKVSGY